MCDRYIFKRNVEFLCALEEVGTDAVGDSFSLGDEFCGIELRNDGFKDFIADGGKDSLVVVLTEVLFAC